MGITAGYHRLWAHKSYEAHFLTQVFLLLCGTGALEGSLKWWAGGHRVHHRYTDTPKDPYNANGGFWYAHMGWMLQKPDPKYNTKSDIRDLDACPMIRAQHKYYFLIGPFMAFAFPTLVAGLGWGDYMGGYFYAGLCRLFFVHHSTFCVNSVAHYFGEHTFDDIRSPKDSVITALLTLGEGYHNFHHEFPNDYRNGIRWYHYDPTKWLIKGLNLIGLTRNLKTFSHNEIEMGKMYMKEKQLQREKSKIIYPPNIETLTVISWKHFLHRCEQQHESLIIVNNIVHDVTSFISTHPGGKTLISSMIGKENQK